MLRGMRMAQSSFPAMDVEHFPPWFFCFHFGKLKILLKLLWLIFSFGRTVNLWIPWDILNYSGKHILLFRAAEAAVVFSESNFVLLVMKDRNSRGMICKFAYAAWFYRWCEAEAWTCFLYQLILTFSVVQEGCNLKEWLDRCIILLKLDKEVMKLVPYTNWEAISLCKLIFQLAFVASWGLLEALLALWAVIAIDIVSLGAMISTLDQRRSRF